MSRFGSLVLGAFFAFCTVALASPEQDLAGVWKPSIGTETACTLTLASDSSTGTAGTASPSPGRASGLDAIGRWKARPAGLQLFSPSGDMVAWLKQKGSACAGLRLSDGRTLALAR